MAFTAPSSCHRQHRALQTSPVPRACPARGHAEGGGTPPHCPQPYGPSVGSPPQPEGEGRDPSHHPQPRSPFLAPQTQRKGEGPLPTAPSPSAGPQMHSHPGSGALGAVPEPHVAQPCGTEVLVAPRAGDTGTALTPPCPLPGAGQCQRPQFGNGGSSRSNSYHDFLFPFPLPGSVVFPWQLRRCRGCVYGQLKLINCTQKQQKPRGNAGGVSPAGDRASPGHAWRIQRDMGGERGLHPPGGTLGWGHGQRGDVCGCCHPLNSPVGTLPQAPSAASTQLRGKGVKPPATSSSGGYQPHIPLSSPALCPGDESSSALGRREWSRVLLEALSARVSAELAPAGAEPLLPSW